MDTYSSVASAETGNAAAGGFPLVLRDDGLQSIADNVPEFVVLVLQQEDQTGGLGVERRGYVFDELRDDLFDAVV